MIVLSILATFSVACLFLIDAQSNVTTERNYDNSTSSFNGSLPENITWQPSQQSDCECGIARRLSVRIVGGERTNIAVYPWVAGLAAYGYIYCGGAVLNELYILTAAHCFKEVELEFHAEILVGITDRRDFSSPMKISEIILHEKYNRSIKGQYDIALIRLEEPLKFNNKIRPLCLPNPTVNYTGLYATVAGWGVLEHGGEVSNELHGVAMKILDNQYCHSILPRVDDNNLCAGGEKGKDACQGDSGSPLFVRVENAYHIIGLVSWGLGCAQAGIPGVFTNVTHYLPWIIEHTKDARCPVSTAEVY